MQTIASFEHGFLRTSRNKFLFLLMPFNTDTSDCCPLSLSSCRGISCKVPASSICPRRASGLLGVERCGPQPSQALRCHVAGTPRKEGEAVRTSCSPVSSGCCILVQLLTGSLPNARLCVPCNTFPLQAQGSDNPDVCRERLVYMALLTSKQFFSIAKAPENFEFSPRLVRS